VFGSESLEEKRFSAKEVNKLLAAHDVKPSKSMGQNFVIDANIPEKLVRLSGVDKSCCVLEIGAGLGALTLQLCKAADHVTAVELDSRLLPILRDVLGDCSNIDLLQGDILKLDIGKLAAESMRGTNRHVCANLPYSITTPAITRLIDADVFRSVTVMVQKEVAMRICAKPGSPDYGAFSVYTNYHTEPEILFEVPPECFMPRPQVTSSVVRMMIRKERLLSGEDENVFFRVVKAAFGQRRKTLVNAVFAVFGNTHSKESITQIVESCGFDARVRGEVLSVGEFIRLSSFFSNILNSKEL